MQKLLTIEVPVYKVEPYINKCLDSCLLYKQDAQGNRILDENLMSQLEVIIVNDGTPDRSAEMSREYTLRYPQTFRQLDKENGGHGSAWNVGLREATGKYLRFLDSDDWLTNLDILMKKLLHCQADVVMTHLNNFHEDTAQCEKWHITDGPFDTLLNIDDFTFDSFYGKTNVMNFLFSTYKTDMLKPLYPLFMEKVMYDDSILYAIPFIFARSYVYYDIVLYNYLSGRAGQSMNVTVQKNNIPKLLATYKYEMVFISRYENSVSPARRKSIHRIMASDSAFLLNMLVYLPYKECKKHINDLRQYFHLDEQEWQRGKMTQRFVRYPFCLFYFIEKLRRF